MKCGTARCSWLRQQGNFDSRVQNTFQKPIAREWLGPTQLSKLRGPRGKAVGFLYPASLKRALQGAGLGTRLCPDMVLSGCLAVAEKLVSCLVLPFQAGAVLRKRAEQKGWSWMPGLVVSERYEAGVLWK